MKKGRFLWSAHRITEKQKAGKARNIKEKRQLKNFSTVSKPHVALLSSPRDKFYKDILKALEAISLRGLSLSLRRSRGTDAAVMAKKSAIGKFSIRHDNSKKDNEFSLYFFADTRKSGCRFLSILFFIGNERPLITYCYRFFSREKAFT